MKFTYANVTSTIALMAALTTGTSYAANTVLARDSVRSPNIKNGQVTLADLHPTVRMRLQRGTTGGGATPVTGTLAPVGEWRDTGALYASGWGEQDRTDGVVNLASRIGTTGRVEFRVVGSLTKPAGNGAQATLYVRNASGAGKGGWGFGLPRLDQSGTHDASLLEYQPTGSLGTDPKVYVIDAVNAQQIEVRYEGKDATSTLRVQVRRIA